jgi:hypothetical protein
MSVQEEFFPILPGGKKKNVIAASYRQHKSYRTKIQFFHSSNSSSIPFSFSLRGLPKARKTTLRCPMKRVRGARRVGRGRAEDTGHPTWPPPPRRDNCRFARLQTVRRRFCTWLTLVLAIRELHGKLEMRRPLTFGFVLR